MGVIAADRLTSYRQRVAAFEPLTVEQEGSLAKAWRAGDTRAGERLIEVNLAFVIRIAREYRRWGTPLDDLIQQGNIGLLKAAERFDPARRNTLRTYAAYWIRAEIREYVVRHYRIVRLGTTRSERRAVRAFRATKVDSVSDLVKSSGMPEARCKLLWPILSKHDGSLDDTRNGRARALDFVRDPGRSPEEILSRQQERELVTTRVRQALSGLSEREQRIVRARMMSEEPQTLEQLGKQMGVSRERVRQLECRARAKIKDALAHTHAA